MTDYHYVPKGGMCASCIKRIDDCSELKFGLMFPIETDTRSGIVYVRCTEHIKDSS